MAYFVCRLLPPRSTFPADMTDEERALMQEHVAYWTRQLEAGRVVVFGPVADPSGSWGLGVIRADDLASVERMEADDPVVRAGRGFRWEILPMPQAIVAS